MHVEFVGLPGCGKTTLAEELEKRLVAEGFRAQGLRNAAKAAIDGVKDEIGFLRRRGERVSLYGCFAFAHKNPELFEWFFRMSHKDFTGLSWGMECLSQLGILQEHGDADLVVLNDEGFLQRLSWNFIDLQDGPEVGAICALLPDDFLTVHMILPADVAYARTKGRKKGVPIALRREDGAETLARFGCYDAMQNTFVTARRDRGCVVYEVDAMQDLEALVEEVIHHLHRHLPAPAPVPAKKARKVRS